MCVCVCARKTQIRSCYTVSIAYIRMFVCVCADLRWNVVVFFPLISPPKIEENLLLCVHVNVCKFELENFIWNEKHRRWR